MVARGEGRRYHVGRRKWWRELRSGLRLLLLGRLSSSSSWSSHLEPVPPHAGSME